MEIGHLGVSGQNAQNLAMKVNNREQGNVITQHQMNMVNHVKEIQKKLQLVTRSLVTVNNS